MPNRSTSEPVARATPRFGRVAPGIAVRDLDAAVAFYRDVLGMTVTFTNGEPVSFAIVEKDAAELHLSAMPDHEASTLNVAHLIVDDATALHDHLVAAGTQIVKGLRDHDFGLRAFVFADPDGNRIDVGEPLD
jgi:catechol 2,3-dioxygenase-like lactoylglutathione lyase family enzyme